jgi:dTDP-4-dehydrorhamnose reductase
MKTKSALIIGSDGLVGAGVLRLFRAKGVDTYATTRRRPLHSSDIFLDLSDRDLAKAELPQTEVAIICAAANGFAHCRSNPEMAKRVNADAPLVLARKLSPRGTRVIYLSSSAVFDFSRPHMAAQSRHCPSTIYGKFKAMGEEGVLSVGQRATIVRLTKVLTPDMHLFRNWIDKLHSGKNVQAFSDLYFCPISLDYATNALLAITEAGLQGTVHVSGADDISYFKAALRIATRMEVDDSRIIEDRAAARGTPPEEIARFTSLDSSRYTALTGELPPQPIDVLDEVYGPAIARAAAAQ